MRRTSSAKTRHAESIWVEGLESRRLFSVTFGPVSDLQGFPVEPYAVADLNGDGKPDIVGVGEQNNDGIEIFVNKGNGTFGAPIVLPYSGTTGGLAIGDFNGDGVPDIAIESGNGTVSCYLGSGVNIGGATPSFSAPVVSSYAIAPADARPLNVGTGTTSVGTTSQLQTAHFGGSMDDLVVDDATNGNLVQVLLATGGGHFQTGTANILAGPGDVEEHVLERFAIADLNGDGISDIAYGGVVGNGYGIIVQYGAIGGTFLTSQYPYAVPPDGPVNVLAATLTSPSGLPDLICNTESFGDVDVLLNNGGGSFGAAVSYPVTNSQYISVGDFDGNGALDISAGSQILFNTGAGTFSPAQDVDSSYLYADRVSADLNGDGHADLVEDGAFVQLEGASNGGGGGGGGGGSNPSALSPVLGKSTLPKSVVVGGTSHGQVTVDVTNSASTISSGATTVAIYASTDGSIDSSAVKIGSVSRRLKLKSHARSVIVIPIKSLPASLSGSYTLLAQVTDPSGGTSVSSAGSTLTAAAPFINFSEILVRATLAASDVTGKKTRAAVQLRITNGGNIASSGKTTIALYVSPDTTAADGSLVRSVSESIVLKPDASRVVSIPLLSIPGVADGNYHLVARVTDPKGDVTTVASAGTYALAAS